MTILADLRVAGIAFLRGIPFLVAVHTSSHRQIPFSEKAIPLSHLSVTLLAFRPRDEMRSMAKEDIIRQLVHRDPRDLLSTTVEGGQLLDRGTFFLNYLMTCHAIGAFGEAHGVARIRIGMAVQASKAQRKMLLVTVGNGLFRSLKVRS
jgi:hypothetical protein